MQTSLVDVLSKSLGPKDYTIEVLLVDDQEIIGEAVSRQLACEEGKGIRLHFVSNPAKALEKAKEIKPTVILQDLVMPEIDGLTLLKYYRASKETKSVPIIVLSSKEEPIVKAEAFALGANDYLVKLPDKIELIARIRYHSQSYINELQKKEAFDTLAQSQKVILEELAEAEHYVRSLLPQPIDEKGVKTAWEFMPCRGLGGDSFGYFWLDETRFCLYVLDVCGHGVGAALLSISAMNALNSQLLPGVDFRKGEEVLAALNNRFPMEEHNGKFFTLWYGVYDMQKKTLRYACAGHPPQLLRKDGELVELKTPGMMIGGMADATFKAAEVAVSSGDVLYLFSDGVYEIPRKSDNEMLGFGDFVTAVKATKSADECARLKAWAVETQGRADFDDDFSLVSVAFA